MTEQELLKKILAKLPTNIRQLQMMLAILINREGGETVIKESEFMKLSPRTVITTSTRLKDNALIIKVSKN